MISNYTFHTNEKRVSHKNAQRKVPVTGGWAPQLSGSFSCSLFCLSGKKQKWKHEGVCHKQSGNQSSSKSKNSKPQFSSDQQAKMSKVHCNRAQPKLLITTWMKEFHKFPKMRHNFKWILIWCQTKHLERNVFFSRGQAEAGWLSRSRSLHQGRHPEFTPRDRSRAWTLQATCTGTVVYACKSPINKSYFTRKTMGKHMQCDLTLGCGPLEWQTKISFFPSEYFLTSLTLKKST